MDFFVMVLMLVKLIVYQFVVYMNVHSREFLQIQVKNDHQLNEMMNYVIVDVLEVFDHLKI